MVSVRSSRSDCVTGIFCHFTLTYTITSPALGSGLKVGDQILSVDGHSLRSVTHREALQTLRASGDRVKLEIFDENTELEQFDQLTESIDEVDHDKVVVVLPRAVIFSHFLTLKFRLFHRNRKWSTRGMMRPWSQLEM